MTQEDVWVATDVVVGTSLLENQYVHVLMDLGATYSFMARKIKNILKKQPIKLEKGFFISTSFGDVVLVEHMYKSVKVTIEGYGMEVNVMPLELHDFNLILEIDWLSNHKHQMDLKKNSDLSWNRWEESDF
jgi:tartrate dehydratase beta subunit/fumarate hydratase class I family protein